MPKLIWNNEKFVMFAPVLDIFDPNLSNNSYTDASPERISAILKQGQSDGKEKTEAYFSKKLNETQ